MNVYREIVDNYETKLTYIKEITGKDDLDGIIDTFITNEKNILSLYNLVCELSSQVRGKNNVKGTTLLCLKAVIVDNLWLIFVIVMCLDSPYWSYIANEGIALILV